MHLPAWLSPFVVQRTRLQQPRTIAPLRKPRVRTAVSRRARVNMSGGELQRMQLVTVPNESHMATPGEVRHVSLDYNLFKTILQSGSTTFGILSIEDWSSRRGCVLSILNISNLLPDASPRVEVECRCSGRFDAANISSAPTAWTLLSAECSPVSDWPVYEAEDRQQIADMEWRVWKSCCDVAKLMRRVRTDERGRIGVEQELTVWAPKEYDRKVTADEWEATPLVTRHVWCERAESFSFGVLRRMEAPEDVMARARGMTMTLERLELCLESVELRRARAHAEISLRDAFG